MAFYSIVASMKNQYEVAIIAIFVGMIADSLDGRVARLTNTQSEFGVQYDSLSDMVTFGVAPSLAAYSWALVKLGKLGWLVAFFYTASVAIRLARFNTQAATEDKRYFTGLPCPAGAGVVASCIWFIGKLSLHQTLFAVMMAVTMLLVALLMVSNVRFYSFKDLDFKGRVSPKYVILTLGVFIGVAAYPALVLLVSFGIYALSGPVLFLLRRKRLKKKSKGRGQVIK